ncbi:SCAN domain-containing protein 3-like [Galendromus occidentalis]|uniref:SCAN domain-containing protein 3-like n=1 Tax=Galendromus occidentalis TaxID=34638 RepID=A0AAJ7SJ87_9ACAR|nr:SCAN domain-containing protein 3-like [Galendromus occidentalis]
MSNPKTRPKRRYSEQFLKFGFIAVETNRKETAPLCLICLQVLSNESMRSCRLQHHLKSKHPQKAASPLEYFESLKESFENRPRVGSLFANSRSAAIRVQRASYEISLLIAKTGNNHSVGEQLIKPAIATFLKTVGQTDDKEVAALPLSNNTVCRRIDRMAEDIEQKLVEKLRSRSFSLQMDESTIRQSEALLMSYVRYIDQEDLKEEMLFCRSLETTTTATDIYKQVREYLSEHKIPIENMVSCVADGAPAMMGRKKGCLKMLKDDNPGMLTIHCVIHRENLVARTLSPSLHKVMQAVIKCVNEIKAKPKFERLFEQFCHGQQEAHVRLLIHTEIRWLSKGNCLRRFMELFDAVVEFLKDKEEVALLTSFEGKILVSYLADIFDFLNGLNLKLQGKKVSLIEAQESIQGFIKFLRVAANNVRARNSISFLVEEV